ncbi:hypothetical protein VNI00_016457 [Paramarasmius palmivorus]|uniref:Uncharacterized protein n=1 Tax=Paramarasmius palmivorus TaxID=297713 RepID=A0AAW0BF53_9AGAR
MSTGREVHMILDSDDENEDETTASGMLLAVGSLPIHNGGLTSKVYHSNHSIRITPPVKVLRLERITELASIYPICEVPTALWIDLRENDKYHVIDEATAELYTMDHLIKDKDNEAWKGCTGNGQNFVLVYFSDGQGGRVVEAQDEHKNGFFLAQRGVLVIVSHWGPLFRIKRH